MNQILKTILISVISGVVGGIGVLVFADNFTGGNREQLIQEFYETENAVHVSPHGLRAKMSRGDTDGYVLVDLRSAEEYEKEHIVTAVNVPAYKDPNTSAYEEKERIIGAFRKLKEDNPEKEIIAYCYSAPCMTGRKIGEMLAEAGVFVKHLNIGWNEWRYSWSAWNHDMETPTKVEDFIFVGKEPGSPKLSELPSPCGEGELGC
jgi:rhodanese-related sulfurtransferase